MRGIGQGYSSLRIGRHHTTNPSSSFFVASNYMVSDIRKGDTDGGARHKSASAMAQFFRGNIVMKVGESECKSSMKEGCEMDYFNSERMPTKLALLAAAAADEADEDDASCRFLPSPLKSLSSTRLTTSRRFHSTASLRRISGL